LADAFGRYPIFISELVQRRLGVGEKTALQDLAAAIIEPAERAL